MNIDKANRRAILLYEAGEVAEAAIIFGKVLQKKPYNLTANLYMGDNCIKGENFGAAVTYFKRVLKSDVLRRDSSALLAVYCGLGSSLWKTGLYEEATVYHEKAINLAPEDPKNFFSYYNLGLANYERGIFDEAGRNFRKASELNPEDPRPHANLAHILLLNGNFQEGWEESEFWVEIPGKAMPSFCVSIDEWDGSPLTGEKIFIGSDHHVGDMIMWASCFEKIIDQADFCLVECDQRLIPLFKRSFPKTEFIKILSFKEVNEHTIKKIDAMDWTIAADRIPKFMRPDINSFPRKKSYLIPDPEKVADWRNRLKSLGEGLKVGISWRGGSVPIIMKKRSTTLMQWAPILRIPGVHFINLQYGDCHNDLQEIKESLGITIHDWDDVDPLKDLETSAAQIVVLDLIISVDNTTVHMSGALGVPTWVLLPYICNWRWLRDVEDSYWYPSLRLVRQKNIDDFDELITGVAFDLLKLIETEGCENQFFPV
jgi:Flp pilus assembly protein TadD